MLVLGKNQVMIFIFLIPESWQQPETFQRRWYHLLSLLEKLSQKYSLVKNSVLVTYVEQFHFLPPLLKKQNQTNKTKSCSREEIWWIHSPLSITESPRTTKQRFLSPTWVWESTAPPTEKKSGLWLRQTEMANGLVKMLDTGILCWSTSNIKSKQ